MSLDASRPAAEIFPEYALLPEMYAREVEDLTGEQLDKKQPGKSWGLWSIREQVSHMGFVNYRWFMQVWGKSLFGENLPRAESLYDTGGADRLLDPERFHEMNDLLAAYEDGCRLALDILKNETRESLREKTKIREVPRNYEWPSGDRYIDWIENVVLKIHPDGFWRDEKKDNVFHYNLEWTFRHVLWEGFSHLKTIQAHKQAQGIEAKTTLDEDVGYLAALTWE